MTQAELEAQLEAEAEALVGVDEDGEAAWLRWAEGGWDVSGRYLAEEEADWARAIDAGAGCPECGSVSHLPPCWRRDEALIDEDRADADPAFADVA